MNQLFLNDYISHFSLTNPSNTNIYISCQQGYFEIKDESNKNLSIHSQRNTGEAKIVNPNQQLMEIINYDMFVSGLDANFQYKRKRCDLIMSSNQSFILGELKDRQNISNARSKAKKQLLKSLTDVLSVPQITNYINTKPTKKCCYFNKQASESTNMTINSAIIAFNRFSNTFPDGLQMEQKGIENLGFEFWQFTGNQTLTLS